jgi:hypothetical protein
MDRLARTNDAVRDEAASRDYPVGTPEHNALLGELRARPGWQELTEKQRDRWELFALGAEHPVSGVLFSRPLKEVGERFMLGRSAVGELLKAGRAVGLVGVRPGPMRQGGRGGAIRGPSIWHVWPAGEPPQEPTAIAVRKAARTTIPDNDLLAPDNDPDNGADNDSGQRYGDRMNDDGASGTSTHSLDSRKALERAEEVIITLQERHGLIGGKSRQLLIEAIIEDEHGAWACYQEAQKRATTNPIGYLITMIRNGDHRGRVYVEAPGLRCYGCGHDRPDVEERTEQIAARFPSWYGPTRLCGACYEQALHQRQAA